MSISKAYDTLPNLHDANVAFKSGNGEKYLNGPIKEAFLRHGMNDRYGVSLLHRHFGMERGHRLVEFGNFATPWKVNEDDKDVIAKFGGWIEPRNFRYLDGRLTPFEFALTFDENHERPTEDFLQELYSLYEESGLTKVLGIFRRPERNAVSGLEFTEGRANITIPSTYSSPASIDAAWVFDESEEGEIVKHCILACLEYDDGDHVTYHDPQSID